MYVWVDEWMDGWMDGCMDVWIDGWMDGWMCVMHTSSLQKRPKCKQAPTCSDFQMITKQEILDQRNFSISFVSVPLFPFITYLF